MVDPGASHHAAMDIGTIVLILGSFAGFLPPFAALLAALWYCVLLYDRFINKKRNGSPE